MISRHITELTELPENLNHKYKPLEWVVLKMRELTSLEEPIDFLSISNSLSIASIPGPGECPYFLFK